MRDLRRRIEHLERTAKLTRCICSTPIVVFAGDLEPEQPRCPQHGRSRVIRWPLPRSRLDATDSLDAPIFPVPGTIS
jgi:hypothetical protein